MAPRPPPKTPKEMVRENQRLLQKSIRELDRERNTLEGQEKRIMADIKKNAKMGATGSLRILATDLVRTRNNIQKFLTLRAHLQAVSLRLQTMTSNQAMGSAMAGVTKALGQMNKTVNLPSIEKIMHEFEQENMGWEMKEEMMTDTLDEAFSNPADEEATDEIVNRVLDEMGVNATQSMKHAPSSSLRQSAQEEALDDDFAARLANLRKA